MRKLLLLLFLLKNSIPAIASPEYDKLWQQANRYYEQKSYDSAAYYYEQLAAKKPEEATVYYNLGNTYYRLNLIGPAVLNYERALHIDPNHKEAKENLSLTQSRIQNRIQSTPDIFFVEWWQSMTHASKAGLWAVGSLVIFILVILALLARKLNRLQFPPQVTLFAIIIYFFMLVLAYFSAQNKADSKKAIVMQQDAPFTAAPQNSKTQSLVPEGTSVKWKSEKDNWVEVALPDGRIGWMQKSALSKI